MENKFYVSDVFDSAEVGMHYVGLRNYPAVEKKYHEVFFDSLPDIIVHPTPVANITIAKELVNQKCKCDRHCWRYNDPWVKYFPLMRRLLQSGLERHYNRKDKNKETLVSRGIHSLRLDSYRDIFQAPLDPTLPLGPDVAIHFRCSDNVQAGGQGMLHFREILSRIPTNTNHVYILSEYVDPIHSDKLLASFAPNILQTLRMDILKHFPNTTVIIKRGGNLFTSWSVMYLAKILIGAPSTFSLWPAVARNSTTYFPFTSYFGKTSKLFYVHKNFHWIQLDNKNIYGSNFTEATSLNYILSLLRSGLD